MGFWDQPLDERGSLREFTGLRSTGYPRCVEIAVDLLEMDEWDAQATDFHDKTASSELSEGALCGCEYSSIELEQSLPNPSTTANMATQLSRASQKVVRGRES